MVAPPEQALLVNSNTAADAAVVVARPLMASMMAAVRTPASFLPCILVFLHLPGLWAGWLLMIASGYATGVEWLVVGP
jgi:hypothetical protein